MTIIVWLRNDLRLDDNPALEAALRLAKPIICAYIWSPEEESFKLGRHKLDIGAASRVWLYHTLKNLDNQLRKHGSRLVIRSGSSLEELNKLIDETQANHVFWNRRYEPHIIKRDRKIAQGLSCTNKDFNASLLIEPDEIVNKQGKPYKVFTPYYKAALARLESSLVARPSKINLKSRLLTGVKSLEVEDLELLPKLDWHRSIEKHWQLDRMSASDRSPGAALIKNFIRKSLPNYHLARDIPSEEGTSRFSPYLRFGQLSPRMLWHAIKDSSQEDYLRQLIWREFSYYLLYHFPETVNQPFNTKFAKFPWRRSAKNLKLWQQGLTGYPIVDAGMQELWQTGWMHNRIRMIAGSFLVKDLMISWQEGAAYFWETLVDADLANNTMGWQWIAGCGADAAPYFRIFNPETQAKKFDPEKIYINKWLKNDDTKLIVNHAQARIKALESFNEIK